MKIESITETSDKKTQVVIYIEEKSLTSNEIKRCLASDITAFMNAPNLKQNLVNSGIENVIAMISPDDDQLKEYLEIPPKGIDARMWKQAQKDNPDPQEFIPVPILGNHQVFCLHIRKLKIFLNFLLI